MQLCHIGALFAIDFTSSKVFQPCQAYVTALATCTTAASQCKWQLLQSYTAN